MERHQPGNHTFCKLHGNNRNHNGLLQILQRKKSIHTDSRLSPTEESSIPGIRRWPKEYLPKIFEPERVDRVIDVSQQEATEMARKLAKVEGVFAGMSSGGAASAAIRLATELSSGVIVFIVCDRGDRYLSSNLFG